MLQEKLDKVNTPGKRYDDINTGKRCVTMAVCEQHDEHMAKDTASLLTTLARDLTSKEFLPSFLTGLPLLEIPAVSAKR